MTFKSVLKVKVKVKTETKTKTKGKEEKRGTVEEITKYLPKSSSSYLCLLQL